jgi:hypothetical protein
MTPQAAIAIPFKVGDDEWLLARGIPGDVIEHLKETGIYAVEGEQNANRN